MTDNQVQKYEYCKKYLIFLNSVRKEIPIQYQNYGCGRNAPNIEHHLEKIHNKMYEGIFGAIKRAENEVNEIIGKI